MNDTTNTNATSSVPRLVLATRRVVWMLGIIPIMLTVATIGYVGLVVGICWMVGMWLSGSRGKHDLPIITAMGAVELVWEKWDRLREDPARQNAKCSHGVSPLADTTGSQISED